MKIQIDLNYWADVLDGDQFRQTYITVPVWVDSRNVPEPPSASAITACDQKYKCHIEFQRSPDGETEVALGAWTSGEPGKLYADKVALPSDDLPPAAGPYGGTF